MIRRVITYKCISPPPDISQWAILIPKSLVVSKSAKSVPIHYSDLQLCHTKIPNQDTISLPMRKCTKDAGSISQLNMIVFCWGISKESLSMVLFTVHNNVCTVSFTHFHFLEFITWWSSELMWNFQSFWIWICQLKLAIIVRISLLEATEYSKHTAKVR